MALDMNKLIDLNALKRYNTDLKTNVIGTLPEGSTVAAELATLAKDLTFKGTTTTAVSSPAEGDLYYFNIPATETEAAVVGWKFWSTKDAETGEWKELSDATLATRVGALETQVGKDKAVTTYEEKTDLVDVVNVLTADKTTEGSIAETVYGHASEALCDDFNGNYLFKEYKNQNDETDIVYVNWKPVVGGYIYRSTIYGNKFTEESGSITSVAEDESTFVWKENTYATTNVEHNGQIVLTIRDMIYKAKSEAATEIAALDVTDTALATATDGVVTIKAVKEVDGKIAASEDTTKDITLAKVATTGAAEDVTIDYWAFTSKNVAGAIEENYSKISTLNGTKYQSESVLNSIFNNAKDAKYSTKEMSGFSWYIGNNSFFTESATPQVGDSVWLDTSLGGIVTGSITAVEEGTNKFTATYVGVNGALVSETNSTEASGTATTFNAVTTIAEAIEDAASGSTKVSKVNVIKQETAESGYSATYYVTQNDEQVGEKINIPKDFLVKSAKLIRYELDTETNKYYDAINDPEKEAEIDALPSGIEVSKIYIDFVINAKDASEAEEHIYLNVSDLVDAYTGKTVDNGISVAVSDANEISATVSGKAIGRENITDTFNAAISALEATHAAGKEIGSLKTVSAQIKDEAKDATYTYETKTYYAYWTSTSGGKTYYALDEINDATIDTILYNIDSDNNVTTASVTITKFEESPAYGRQAILSDGLTYGPYSYYDKEIQITTKTIAEAIADVTTTADTAVQPEDLSAAEESDIDDIFK